MHSIVHKIWLDLHFVISIATSWISSTHVVTFVHDLGINKSHIASHILKQNKYIFLFYQTFNNKTKFHNIFKT
jgi:hypothetical protein